MSSRLSSSRLSRLAIALTCLAVAAACAENTGAPGGDSRVATARTTPDTERRPCASTERPIEPQGPSEPTTVLRGEGPRVEAVAYPRPGYKGELWTQWGQGIVLEDGRFVSAIGDHAGADGNSYFFVFDPATSRLTRFADVLSRIDHQPGAWGYGKIHAQLVAGPCNEVYIATYWGTREGLRYDGTYRGDRLFRLDPATLELEDLGPPVPEHGIPSLASDPANGLVYGEATDPARSNERTGDRGAFFVFDTAERRVVFESDANFGRGSRRG